ncbi:CehA/McbA family metallohydrolase [Nocardioides aestuarii]|uniref:CehA/McbA family metallohydrolase n=1 Tax=Nocardioides aestuarii TaxID=252231 RepID=A0ABW4TM26_9ACTN
MTGIDRRSLLLAGAGVVTVSPLAVFSPAAAGRSRTHVFRGEFTRADTPDWHYLPFRVPRGVRRISVNYRYRPTETGVGVSYNVVDIGIFDPSGHGLGDARGFRGWSGGARRSFSISRRRATPGYLPGPITPGVWHIALGPYLITPPGTPWRVEVTLHFGEQATAVPPVPAPTEVAGRGPGWYRVDLHTHTAHSDGSRTRPALVEEARAAGLHAVGSSEHNTSSATRSWGRYAPDDLLVVAGEEVTTRAGHWLAMGVPAGTWVDWRYRPEDDRLSTFTGLVRDLGGVAIACHPNNPVPSIQWGYGHDYADVDAVEVWNGPWGYDDQITLSEWDGLLREGRFVPAVGTSDSHHSGQPVGLAQTVLRMDALSTASLVAAVRGGHGWLAESSAVDLTLEATAGGTTAGCGDTLAAAPDALVTVTMTADGVAGCVGQLLGPAGVLAGVVATGDSLTVSAELPAAAVPYVRGEVRRTTVATDPLTSLSALPMVAMTNPVFVSAPGGV